MASWRWRRRKPSPRWPPALLPCPGDVIADVIPFLAHEINAEVMAMVVERFTGHIPKHQWEEVQMSIRLR